MSNIFDGTGDNAQLIVVIDELLRSKDGYTTYDDIIEKYTPEETESSKTNNSKYSCIKKAVNTMKGKLNEMGLDFDYNNGKNAKKGFRYPTSDPDPFKTLRENKNFKLTKQYLKKFCMAFRYMIPQPVAEKKLPQLLFNEVSCPIIVSDSNPNLYNIDLLPDIYEYIEKQKVITFTYNAGYISEQHVVFHPHFLKEYNNRWFLWGCLEKEDGTIVDACNYSIDRIKPNSLHELNDKKYISKDPSLYLNLLNAIVGVTIPKDKEKVRIIIETLDEKVHGLMKSKPIHWSQKEIESYVDKERTGKFELHLIPNIEFFGNILHYGKSIRIIEPLPIKEKMKKEIEKMMEAYT